MPYIKLEIGPTQRILELREPVVRLGRDPSCQVSFSGDDARVVSGLHAELQFGDAGWRLLDAGSRNGTFLKGQRLTAETGVKAGDHFSLGEKGPRISIVAVTEALEETLAEYPKFEPASVPAPHAPEVRQYGVTLIAAASGQRFEAIGTRIRIGRGKECEIRPVAEKDGIVSRVHAELTVGPSGGLAVRDAGSKNGTFLNNEKIAAAVPVRLGDRITLGPGGPVLVVEGIGTSPVKAVPRPAPAVPPAMGAKTVMGLINNALVKAKEERQRGGRGSTAFLKAVAEEVGKDSSRKIRWLTTTIIVLVLLLGGGVYGVYWLLTRQVAQTEAERHTSEDAARAESERLRQE